MNKMRILITGGAGFIGSHLCDKYVGEGHTVICYDNFSSGNIDNIKHLLGEHKNFKLIEGDIRNKNDLEKYLRDCDVVFNMAAQIHVDKSYIDPKLTFDVNVGGTQNILELSRLYDIQKVIHASSSEVYGSAQTNTMNETHPLDPPHPYGASKASADRLCYAYAKTYGLNIFYPRMFNVFGPRQRSVGYGGVISIFVRRVLLGFSPIVFGDGEQTRDYTYVSDIVEAYDLLFKSNNRFDVTNFGSGKEISIKELSKTVIKMCGKDLEPTFVNPRLSEVNRLICDYSKAKKLYGWEPKTEFFNGLKMFIENYKKFGL